MIISEDLVRKTGVCERGVQNAVTVAQANGSWGNSVEESLQILASHNATELVMWVTENLGRLIEATGQGIYSDLFRVKDLDAQTYTEFSDLQLAQQQLASIKQQFLKQNSQTLAVNQVVYDEQGNATWIPVKLNSVTEDGHFNVFDPDSGVNNLCTTLSEAKILAKQIQDKYLVLHQAKFSLEQKISHPDGDTGWTTILSQQ
jgi:hypothetical protein